MVTETKEGLKILTGEGGQKSLFINSDKLSECIKYLYDYDLRYITITNFQGYAAKDINFLEQLENFLEGLSILETYFDYRAVNKLKKLKFLGIPDNGRDIIDLNNFPDLETCGVTFSNRLKGLETCNKLKSLTISNYKSSNLSILPLLPSLEHLNLIKTNILNLQGIEQFSRLSKLEIFRASKLEHIAALQVLSNNLREIQIEQSRKIKDYEILRRLKGLRKLILSESGELSTIAFIKSLPKLEFFSFWGTNVLDGDISPCKGLNYVGFDSKKHYTHKFEDFQK